MTLEINLVFVLKREYFVCADIMKKIPGEVFFCKTENFNLKD